MKSQQHLQSQRIFHRVRIRKNILKNSYKQAELGTRSFFHGSLSAPHSIFSPGSLTLLRSFFEFSFSLVAQTLVAQPVVRWAKKG